MHARGIHVDSAYISILIPSQTLVPSSIHDLKINDKIKKKRRTLLARARAIQLCSKKSTKKQKPRYSAATKANLLIKALLTHHLATSAGSKVGTDDEPNLLRGPGANVAKSGGLCTGLVDA